MRKQWEVHHLVAEWLSSPEHFPQPTFRVERVETHISSVFLTDEFVYKLKKPVAHDFIDYSSATKRRAFCQEEVTLNSRMAPGVYLGVLDIGYGKDGRLVWDGKESPVASVVWMKRLPADRMLDRLIKNREITVGDMAFLAERLVDFYGRHPDFARHPERSEGPPKVEISPDRYAEQVRELVIQNRQSLLGSDVVHEWGPDCLTSIKLTQASQLVFLFLEQGSFEQRAAEGRIIEGHGDLRPEHVCMLEDAPVVFDCIEFNLQLRTLDVIDELAFFAVECEELGDEEAGRMVLETYQEATGDQPPEELVEFYKSYRASVRAKVDLLRAAQMNPKAAGSALSHARRHLELASRHAAGLAPRIAIMVGGSMGTGKTTLARELARRLGAEHEETDRIRREIFGPSPEKAPYGEGIYKAENRRRVYAEMLERAKPALESGIPVVVDGSFLSAEDRLRAMEALEDAGATPLILWCHCPESVAAERIQRRLAQRTSPSEARPDLLARAREEGTIPEPAANVLHVDTTTPLEEQVGTARQGLSRWLERPRIPSPPPGGKAHGNESRPPLGRLPHRSA